jgi:hypothetical protein
MYEIIGRIKGKKSEASFKTSFRECVQFSKSLKNFSASPVCVQFFNNPP